jgi:hypothetical protein
MLIKTAALIKRLDKNDIERIINGCASIRGWSKGSSEYTQFYSTFFGLWVGMTTMGDRERDGL